MNYLEAVSHAKKGFKVRRKAWKDHEFISCHSPEPFLVHNTQYKNNGVMDDHIADQDLYVYVCEIRDVEADDWICCK